MANALIELMDFIKDKGPIEALVIDLHTVDSWEPGFEGGQIKVKLKPGFTEAEVDAAYKSLNVKYDSGYGTQHLFGVIWFQDGTWATRGEYDGSEWWQYHRRPDIEDTVSA